MRIVVIGAGILSLTLVRRADGLRNRAGALMALATDAPLDDAVVDALREGDGIRSVDIVHLG